MRINKNGMIENNGKLISLKPKPIRPINKLPIQINQPKKHSSFGCHNPNRFPYVFTPLEFKAIEHLNGFIEHRKIYHEYRIQCRDLKGKSHTYWLDLYDSLTKTCVEISPKFHKTYKSVLIRDTLRAKLLKKQYGIETIHISGKNKKEINRLIQYMKYKGISKETLDYYAESIKD